MRSILENVTAFDLHTKVGLRFGTITQTLGATYNFAPDQPVVAFLDCGASGRTVVLPSILNGTGMDGRVHIIVNIGAANNLTVNAHADDSSSLVCVLTPGDQATVTASSAKGIWYADIGPADFSFLTGVTAGTVTASKAVVVDASKNIGTFGTITAAQYIASAGTATVAPELNAAGTLLTTAALGASEFDGKVYYDTSVASSRQVRDTEQFVCLTANGPTDNGSLLDAATAAAVFRTPTNGTLTVAASTTYSFEAMYYLSNTGTTSHTWSTLFAGTATFTSIAYLAMAYTGTTSGATITAMSAAQVAVATAVAVTAASTSATEFVTVWLRGVMRINAAGTLIPQLKASARPGATGTPGVTILAGSYFRAWPLGVDTVASVGNWS